MDTLRHSYDAQENRDKTQLFIKVGNVFSVKFLAMHIVIPQLIDKKKETKKQKTKIYILEKLIIIG